MPLEGEKILILLVDAVFQALTKMNMPRDFVRNENRWREAQIDSSTDKDIADGSPTSSSKYFETLLQRHKVKSTPEQTQKRWLNY